MREYFMDQYSKLKTALQDFMTTASSRDASKVSAALKRLDALQNQLDTDAPPMLRHYMERRSYSKALAFLETGESESPAPKCGNS
jgi:DNA-binding SARP family transcriptional activator